MTDAERRRKREDAKRRTRCRCVPTTIAGCRFTLSRCVLHPGASIPWGIATALVTLEGLTS